MSQFPSYGSLGGDDRATDIMQRVVDGYAEAGQSYNAGMGVWNARTWYDASVGNLSMDDSIHKHIDIEMREALGLPIHGPIAPVAPRDYRGNMCGVRILGLPLVPGGSQADPNLVLSWFYDRYDADWRGGIRRFWELQNYPDVLLSWPDSRAVGATPESFVVTCRELVESGFRPCVMLLSKDYDPHYDVPGCLENIREVLPLLLNPRAASRMCIGWELSLWLSPTDVQQLTDVIAPQCVAADVKCYVHFQEGYASFQQEGDTFASYWNANVGKLTGILHQRNLTWSNAEYQSRMNDVLQRFAGGFNCSPDSGFGHPFDLIALEISAQPQYIGQMTEAQGNALGRVALASPGANGPFGPVVVMGSGNGQ